MADSFISESFSIPEDMIFVTASATAILEAAAEFIIAHGVLSPIDIASPVEEKKLERVTELSATGTCQGPTI